MARPRLRATIAGMPNESFLDTVIEKPGALTHYANVVKGRGQQRGATVTIAQAEEKHGAEMRRFYVAGINSGSRGFTDKQLELLTTWNVRIAPCVAKGMKKGPHAEENIAAYLSEIRAKGLRWSHAVVGAHIDTARGSRSYVCQACRSMVALVGGAIEDPHNLRR